MLDGLSMNASRVSGICDNGFEAFGKLRFSATLAMSNGTYREAPPLSREMRFKS